MAQHTAHTAHIPRAPQPLAPQPRTLPPWPPRGVRPSSITATEQICREAIRRAATGDRVCTMAFSGGKDSVCLAYALSQFFETLLPVFWYYVPGLSFIEQGLTYYERAFNMAITRLPHPWRFYALVHYQWQPPHRLTAMNEIVGHLPSALKMDDLIAELRTSWGLDGTRAPHATGIRAADSPTRAGIYRKYGGFSPSGNVCYPVITWNLDDIEACLDYTGLLLPPEYEWIGRSFDGLNRRYLHFVREHYPADLQRIYDDFPLAALEFFRAEVVTGLDAPHMKPLYSTDRKKAREAAAAAAAAATKSAKSTKSTR